MPCGLVHRYRHGAVRLVRCGQLQCEQRCGALCAMCSRHVRSGHRYELHILRGRLVRTQQRFGRLHTLQCGLVRVGHRRVYDRGMRSVRRRCLCGSCGLAKLHAMLTRAVHKWDREHAVRGLPRGDGRVCPRRP